MHQRNMRFNQPAFVRSVNEQKVRICKISNLGNLFKLKIYSMVCIVMQTYAVVLLCNSREAQMTQLIRHHQRSLSAERVWLHDM